MDLIRRLFRRPPPADFLDRPFLAAGGQTLLTLRQLCQGALVLGMVGSGKTSAVIRGLLAATFASPGMGAMVACPKDGDCAMWLRLAAKHGRSDDCIVIGPEAKNRVDFFGVLSRLPADPATLAFVAAAGLDAFTQVAGRDQAKGHGEDGKFWAEQYARLMRNTLHLHYLAGVTPSAASILAAVTDMPTPRQLKSKGWRDGPLAGLLRAAHASGRPDEFKVLNTYFTVEMVKLSSRTRGVVVATVTGVGDGLQRGVCGRVLGGGAGPVDLEAAIDQGKIILVDFPAATWGEVARFVTVGVAYLVKLAARKRAIRADTPPFPIVIDECQLFVTDDDFQHAAVSRSSRCPLVLATQGVEQFWAIYSGDSGRAKADVLTGNLGTSFVCLPSFVTADWMSKKIGRERKRFRSGGADNAAYQNPLDLIGFSEQAPRITASWSEQLDFIVPPESMLGYRTGGASRLVDCLVHQPGRTFANGRGFTIATFTQEG